MKSRLFLVSSGNLSAGSDSHQTSVHEANQTLLEFIDLLSFATLGKAVYPVEPTYLSRMFKTLHMLESCWTRWVLCASGRQKTSHMGSCAYQLKPIPIEKQFFSWMLYRHIHPATNFYPGCKML